MIDNYFIESRRIAREMVRESWAEYLRYKKGDGIIFLQQACEKMFNAFEKYLELKYRRRVTLHTIARDYARRNQLDDYLMKTVDVFHRFFYHGESFEDTKVIDIEKDYVLAYPKIQSKINNL